MGDKQEYEHGDSRATSQQGFVQSQKQDTESTYHGVGFGYKMQCFGFLLVYSS